MRIGVLTIPFNNNYGGYLQSYALMNVLKNMGHSPTVIMRRQNRRKIRAKSKLLFFIRNIIKTIKEGQRYPLLLNQETRFMYRGINMLSFVNQNIQPQTKYIYTTKDLQTECKDSFDAYIVGSDQVWRPIYVKDFISNYFLDFVNGAQVKRISYGASFGSSTPEFTDAERLICGNLLEQFDAVSVREKGALDVIENFGWKANNKQVVPDPTMLLSRTSYDKLIPAVNTKAKGRIFCYVLDKNETNNHVIEKMRQSLQKEIYEIADIQKGDTVLPSIETWLSAIRDSDFVITDSYHGTVFSILFNKPFVVCVNKERGADRFVSLLETFGLENHTSLSQSGTAEPIDWVDVNRILEEKKAEGLFFLENVLK